MKDSELEEAQRLLFVLSLYDESEIDVDRRDGETVIQVDGKKILLREGE